MKNLNITFSEIAFNRLKKNKRKMGKISWESYLIWLDEEYWKDKNKENGI
jgi:hypothetical protein